MTKPITLESVVEEFDELFTQSHPGDSGIGGNDPQEPIYDWAAEPQEVKDFIRQKVSSLLTSLEERVEDLSSEKYTWRTNELLYPTVPERNAFNKGLRAASSLIHQLREGKE